MPRGSWNRTAERGLGQGQIGPREVVARAEQRFPELAGERVGEAVAVEVFVLRPGVAVAVVADVQGATAGR